MSYGMLDFEAMGQLSRRVFGLTIGLAVLLGLSARPATAFTFGMVADANTRMVTIFNADTDTVLGSVGPLPSTGFVGDCVIAADKHTGYVTNFGFAEFIIDLTKSPPALATGVNPIVISNAGEDLTLSPRGEALLACDGSAGTLPDRVVSVALTQKRLQTSTFDLGSDCMAVDACQNLGSTNNSILVGSVGQNKIRRLKLDASAGPLKDTGESLSNVNTTDLNNVNCAPQGTSGVAINFSPTQIQSFLVPGLAAVDNRTPTGGNGLSGAFNSAGTVFYVRSGSSTDSGGAVDFFTFNPTTAALGAAPFFSIPITQTNNSSFGVEQIAVHPAANKLYVPQPNALKIYNATTGAFITSITSANIVDPTGVCLQK